MSRMSDLEQARFDLHDDFEPGWLDKLNLFEPVINVLADRVEVELEDRELIDEYVNRGHRLEAAWSE